MDNIPYIGELAALATSLFFSLGPTFFTFAGREVGSVVVNRTRLIFASLLLFVAHFIMLGTLWPLDAAPDRWLWLSISGIVGLVIGDAFLFQALIQIGPRLTLLMFSLSPLLATGMAFIFDGETLTTIQILGMGITLAGVGWVVTERTAAQEDQKQIAPRAYIIGLLFALGGAAGQAGGLYTARLGMYGDFPVISAQIIRMLCATALMWIITIFSGQAGKTFRSLREKPIAIKYIAIASVLGPFLGIFFSLLAIQHTSMGVASTLQALPPVFLIPISYFFFKEKISFRAITGTVIALAGVVVLFLV